MASFSPIEWLHCSLSSTSFSPFLSSSTSEWRIRWPFPSTAARQNTGFYFITFWCNLRKYIIFTGQFSRQRENSSRKRPLWLPSGVWKENREKRVSVRGIYRRKRVRVPGFFVFARWNHVETTMGIVCTTMQLEWTLSKTQHWVILVVKSKAWYSSTEAATCN